MSTGMLASVTTVAEARLVLAGGAEIIDLKDPSRGALGALDTAIVRAVVIDIGGRVPVSATVGDLPAMDPAELANAARRMAATGVDYVKLGFFPGGDAAACLAALRAVADDGVRLIAVLFADLGFSAPTAAEFAAAGFAGVMIDTAAKDRGSLLAHARPAELAAFVAAARSAGLLCGLAGSLRLPDIAPLAALRPDYLGFRGALCDAAQRTAPLAPEALRQVRAALTAAVADRAA